MACIKRCIVSGSVAPWQKRNVVHGERHVVGFTLVELMVSVAILAIGIVLILRALVANASALGTSEQKVESVQYLALRMALIEEAARYEAGLKVSEAQESVTINGRKAVYTMSVTPVGEKGLQDAVCQVSLTLAWKEGGKAYDTSLAGYFNAKK